MKKYNNIYPYDIAAVILAYLRGEIGEADERKVEVWLDESDSHKVLFTRILREEMQYRDIQKILSYNASEAWQSVKQKMIWKKRKRLMRIYQIAASVVIVVGVSVAFLLTKEGIKTPVSEVSEIIPGRFAAKLIAASGAVYHLDTLDQVELVTSSAANNGEEVVFTDREIEKNTKEVRYNKIEIPKGGEYRVTLGDGTRVFLNSQTELRFPESFVNTKQRVVYLTGEAYFEVAKDSLKPFIVQCKDYMVKVLGTSFNVNNYEEDKVSKTTLSTGKVEIDMEGELTTLKPGQQAIIREGKIDVKEVDVETYTTWMYENFRFQSESIEEIMTKLSRWYVMDVFYMNESVKNYHFTGYLPRYAKITDVLELLSLTTNIEFNVKGKTVTVMEKS